MSIWLSLMVLLAEPRPKSPPKFVSRPDAEARWAGAHGGQAYFAYSTTSWST